VTSLGTDIATPVSEEGILDLDPAFGLVTGRLQLAQAIGRRITRRRGELGWIGDDPDDGMDVRDYLGSDADATSAFRIEAQVQAEVMRDERVLAAEVKAAIADGILTLSLRLADADGPFRLVLAVSAVTIDLLKVFQ
jgi:hypothetical protein